MFFCINYDFFVIEVYCDDFFVNEVYCEDESKPLLMELKRRVDKVPEFHRYVGCRYFSDTLDYCSTIDMSKNYLNKATGEKIYREDFLGFLIHVKYQLDYYVKYVIERDYNDLSWREFQEEICNEFKEGYSPYYAKQLEEEWKPWGSSVIEKMRIKQNSFKKVNNLFMDINRGENYKSYEYKDEMEKEDRLIYIKKRGSSSSSSQFSYNYKSIFDEKKNNFNNVCKDIKPVYLVNIGLVCIFAYFCYCEAKSTI